jgi:Trypsin
MEKILNRATLLLTIGIFVLSCKKPDATLLENSGVEATGKVSLLGGKVSQSTVALTASWVSQKPFVDCTGVLVADAKVSPMPFVLTASHCVKTLVEISGKATNLKVKSKSYFPQEDSMESLYTGVMLYDFNKDTSLKSNAIVLDFVGLVSMLSFSSQFPLNLKEDLAVLWLSKKSQDLVLKSQKIKGVTIARSVFSEKIAKEKIAKKVSKNALATIDEHFQGHSDVSKDYAVPQKTLNEFLTFPKIIMAGYGVGSATGVKKSDYGGTLRELTAHVVVDSGDRLGSFPAKENEGSCKGDSGGPAFLDGLQLTLVGIESYGSIPCLGGMSVRSSVSYYFDWIVNAVKILENGAE